MSALFRIPSVKRGSATALAELADEFNRHVGILDKLEPPNAHWNSFLVERLSSLLDEKSLLEWETQCGEDEVSPYVHQLEFIHKRSRTLQKCTASCSAPANVPVKSVKLKPSSSHVASENVSKCPSCKLAHPLTQCDSFAKLTPNNRLDFAKKHRLCINCLKGGHMAKDCRSSLCRTCGRKHHSMLHFPPLTAWTLIRVRDVHGVYHFARALLDSGSQSSFVSESLCQKLGLKRTRINLPVSGIGQATVNVHFSVNLSFASRFEEVERQLDCLVLPKLTVSLPSRSVDISRWNIPRNLPLADPRFNISQGVDLIIGAELFYDLLESQQITLANNHPILQKTVLGYVVSGKIAIQAFGTVACHATIDQQLNSQLEKMWEVEDFDVGKAFTQDEQYVEDHFNRTTSRDESGRYVVRLPLKEPLLPLLGDSYKAALNRFSMMERRFAKDEELRKEYTKFMEDYIRLGHMEECSRVAGPQFFLPHHAIRRPDHTTTQIRVVFDGSSKSQGQLSLNEVLFTGPTVQPALLVVVVNFRMPKFVFNADTEKMFRQVWTHSDDRKYLKVLWRTDPSLPLRIYQLKTVTYGLASSPYQAARVLNKLAEDDGNNYPLAAPIVTKRFYVDDVLAGGDNLEEIAEACRQLQQLLARGGFTLRKWSANDAKVLQHIPCELWGTSTQTEIGRNTVTKALGLLWNPATDQFGFQVPMLKDIDVVTKRIVVSEMSQLFDLLGLLGPVIISARIFVQGLLANLGVTWDEELPETESCWWKRYRGELVQLKEITVQRSALSNCRREYQLHCFCDASSKGYGCCVFVVGPNADGILESKLLIAKSRVAPLRGLSIPRLELCAALLGSQLVHNLQTNTDFSATAIFWSDSMVVLHWIHSPPSEWKVFVSNQVAEIHRLTSGSLWRYVPSESNPADRTSRGIQPSQIQHDSLWWQGPQFLTQSAEAWPDRPSSSATIDIAVQEKRSTVVLATVTVDDSIFERYSELGRLQKVVATCIRFSNNCRSAKANRCYGILTPTKVDGALKALVRLAQVTNFPKEIKSLRHNKFEFDCKSPLKNLNLFLDGQDLLRIDGRLKNTNGPFDSKHPIVLPSNHSLTILIARSIHLRTAHSGPNLLLATIRQRFWPLRGRNLVRKVVRNCATH
ncbi:uncharacterized protein LOC129766610 [Toxorhynchites rutilus septentrionalis]|uniref:uncharacterized protein LOC129766610 n=1 Tax=Toxorhynchites rutilus septentrionalis TaxID=329112 RepID=UPI00247AB0F0|nr:uncharacterized protein LOC129766610 [Toxorhynchites rutilus septentrionalis]